MNIAKKKQRRDVARLAVLVLTGPAAAWAQPVSPPASPPSAQHGAGVEEVVVTAQRRKENAQKSSLSLQVLGRDTIRRAGVTQAADLGKVVPGLQIASVGSTVQVFVRGVGDVTTNPLTDPAVAFNVDGIYVGRPSAISSNFFDVDRIEVLKGPQGTLYGRNASGGAVNLIANAPSLSSGITGYVEGELGDYSLKRGAGAVNLPISDTLAARVAFQVVDRDGYLSDGGNDEKHEEARGRVLWKPNADLTITLNADGGHQGGQGASFVLLPQVNPDNPWESINSPASNRVITTYPFLPFPATASRGVPSQDNSNVNVSLQADYNLGFATLSVIPAYRHTDENYVTWGGFLYAQKDVSDQESLEVRLSHSNELLKWVGGFYFFNQDEQVNSSAATNYLFQNIRLAYKPADTSYAGFGEATYSVLPQFRVIGGARYTHETKTLTGGTYDESPLTGPDRLAEAYGPGDSVADSVTWKAGMEYDVTPRSMLFFTAATGFKSGGLNPTEAPNKFAPEKLYAYTLGSRNRFFGNVLQVNGELFYWDYRNKQEAAVGETPAGNFTNTIRNAAAATLMGGSLDVVARLTPADTLRAYGEYNDTTYDQFVSEIPAFLFNPLGISTGCGIGHDQPVRVKLDCSGFPLPHAPKWSGSAAYEHVFDFGESGTLSADIDVQFSSRYYLAIDFTGVEHADAFATANASLTYRLRNWTLTGYVRNFTNAAVYTGGTQDPIAGPLFAANINPPLTYGARLRYEF